MSPMLVDDAAAVRREALRRELVELFSPEQLDVAIDIAARCAHATVALFGAAPGIATRRSSGLQDGVAMEFVIEFFVPPESLEDFHRELETQLVRMSPGYQLRRNVGDLERCIVQRVPAGTFHQYRIASRVTPQAVRGGRWSGGRDVVDGVLVHARSGWHDTEL